jgi:hypothetical protein
LGRHIVVAGLLALVAALISPGLASATHGGDREVTVGSNDTSSPRTSRTSRRWPSTTTATSTVPAGTPDKRRGADRFSPSQVNCWGMAVPAANAGLERVMASG